MEIESGRLADKFDDLIYWILGDRRNFGVVNLLTELFPKIQIKQLEKTPMKTLLISWIDRNKQFLSILIAITILILSPPEWKSSIIEILKAL
jgi:hypothetical protein